jgi:hypothetical protein
MLFIVIELTISISNVQAQSLKISNLNYPAQAVLHNGVAQITITFTVSYSHIVTSGIIGFGPDLVNPDGTFSDVPGSGTTTPDSCTLESQSGTTYAFCFVVPKSSSGTESGSFTFSLNSAQQYKFVAGAMAYDASGKSIGSSLTTQPFTVSVTQ